MPGSRFYKETGRKGFRSMILAVLSAKGGTGKSTIALNLAGIMAS